jgi:hypothetical protein
MTKIYYQFGRHNTKPPELAAKFFARGIQPTGVVIEDGLFTYVALLDQFCNPIAVIETDGEKIIGNVSLQTFTKMFEQLR